MMERKEMSQAQKAGHRTIICCAFIASLITSLPGLKRDLEYEIE
jgi:hypothetical protein